MKRVKRYPIRYDKNPVVIFNPGMVDVIAGEIRKNERKQKEDRIRMSHSPPIGE